MTDKKLKADMKNAVESGIAVVAPVWQRDWENIFSSRLWVGLTDEEIEKIESLASSKLSAIYLAEAQLKGKNAL